MPNTESLLYDVGLGRKTTIHNMNVLGLNPREPRTVVLSHGHADHHGGLEGLYSRVSRRGMLLVLHPDAWRERKVVFPTGNEIRMLARQLPAAYLQTSVGTRLHFAG